VSDPDDPDSEIVWSWSGNSVLSVLWDPGRRAIRIRALGGWVGSETVTFVATDPDGLSDSDEATFTVSGGLASVPNDLWGAGGESQTTRLLGTYPNPFNPATTIRFELGETEAVELRIFDGAGREVATLVNRTLGPGKHEITGDFSTVASGVYFLRFRAGTIVESRRLLLLR
jgi:hypothetical protein